jgi:hypothetical protein
MTEIEKKLSEVLDALKQKENPALQQDDGEQGSISKTIALEAKIYDLIKRECPDIKAFYVTQCLQILSLRLQSQSQFGDLSAFSRVAAVLFYHVGANSVQQAQNNP